MQEQRYNGWANYPTWCVNLWLSNDQGLYEQTRKLVESCAGHSDDLGRVCVSDVLKSFVRDELAPDLGACFAADLLGYALDQVDWLELAVTWIADVQEVRS